MDEVNTLIEAHPEIIEARFERATLRHLQGAFRLALAGYSECIRLKPSMAAAYFNRATTYEKLGEPAKARIDWNRFGQLTRSSEGRKLAISRLAKLQESVNKPSGETTHEK
jgi:tetratricopeptide (TPR) repeat protein